ncbi:MAG: hypothetical protein ACOYNS_17290, partial [Bacteroidota bacterium]
MNKHYSYWIAALLFLCGTAFAQLEIISPAQDSTVSGLTRQVVTARSVSGFDAEIYVNGVFALKRVVRLDGLVDFINVPVPQGDVEFEVRIVNPDGTVAFAEKRMMHILGAPDKIQMEFETEAIEANGSSVARGTAKVFDQWGYLIP